MDEPMYLLCKWEGRLWPAKILRKSARHSRRADGLEVEILGVKKRICVKQKETAPLTQGSIETISLQLDLDAEKQRIIRIFLDKDDSDEEFVGFPHECTQAVQETGIKERDPIQELLYRKALRLALNVLSSSDSHCTLPSNPGKAPEGACQIKPFITEKSHQCTFTLGGTVEPKMRHKPRTANLEMRKEQPKRVPQGQQGTQNRRAAVLPKSGTGEKAHEDGLVRGPKTRQSGLRAQAEAQKRHLPQAGKSGSKRKASGGSSPLLTRENRHLRPRRLMSSLDLKCPAAVSPLSKRDNKTMCSTPTKLNTVQHSQVGKGAPRNNVKPSFSTPSPKKGPCQKTTFPETPSPRIPKGDHAALQNGGTPHVLPSPPDSDLDTYHSTGGVKQRRGRPRLRDFPVSSTPVSELEELSPRSQTRTEESTPKRKAPRTAQKLFESLKSRQDPRQELVHCGKARCGGRPRKGAAEEPAGRQDASDCGRADTAPSSKRRRRNQSCLELGGTQTSEQSELPLPPFEPEGPETDEPGEESDLSIELSLHNEPDMQSSLLQEEDEEEDEELPSFSLTRENKPSSITEGICVWCKFRNYPFWPAMVKRVNHRNKKASIIFIDDLLFDKKRVQKGFCVSLRTLKPFDCEETDQFVVKAREKYNTAINWCLELIRDYRIRKACGSFSGSFIEYFADDISCPVRKMYLQDSSNVSFPSTLIMEEQKEGSDVHLDSTPSRCRQSKKLLPDRSKALRNRANEKLVQFIVKNQGLEKHLQAIISGRENSKWMKEFLKFSRFMSWVDTYLEDEAQVDLVYSYLKSIYENAPETAPFLTEVDTIRFILDVLLPEAIIYAIAAVDKISLDKAEVKFLKGPDLSIREREEFDMQIEKEMMMKALSLNAQEPKPL
nr:PREDICTED: PWWP domain-containing protein MUM1 isoform X1 [Lepisosteus oculatus]XP_015221190.1 PREDICTED: PWWP domain-containing protein MUM1 isoform X1 [Lepisosteus oculatus]XP_015221191.1 PREDICTED: PWWP domain-containing protein MUM1 isoform X1 [Lepisosteus oculatus]XP_015221192.1 PREDICTED: PWWP domain-containing protein MUM1 isoform X1 [Lepisosteus oculatus]XP_015221193.1 PREDICTED: PWWP domain-containing protein MUM1 isoform X1 [Lepisosteus oculatus]